MELLTAIKILGIILSGASIIGSEQLSKIEAKLRCQLKEPEKTLLGGEKISLFFMGLGRIAEILTFLLLFLLFVYLSLGIPFPQPVADFLFFIEHVNLNSIVKIILSFVLASMLIRPFVIITPYGQIPPDFFTLYMWVIGILYLIIAAILRFVSFPYLFLDKQVQKRKVESTLVVLGIILAIGGELLGYFIK